MPSKTLGMTADNTPSIPRPILALSLDLLTMLIVPASPDLGVLLRY